MFERQWLFFILEELLALFFMENLIEGVVLGFPKI